MHPVLGLDQARQAILFGQRNGREGMFSVTVRVQLGVQEQYKYNKGRGQERDTIFKLSMID